MEIVMPKMGESVSEGTIIKWHKNVGDPVKRDEIIFEISTDKVDTEIPSPMEGFLTEIKVKEGETVDVGTVVGNISETNTGSGSSESKEKSSLPTEEAPHAENAKSGGVAAEGFKKDDVKETITESSPVNTTQNLIEIAMPKMGESVMEGTIIKWYKKVGEKVKKDETIFEISTDKVDTEVPSPAEGILVEILVGEQETVDVGTVVAKIGTTGSKVQSSQKSTSEKMEIPSTPASMHDNFGHVEEKTDEGEPSAESGFLSPLVLNIAKKENISFDELKRVKGTGLSNRITKKDLLLYIENKKAGVSKKPSKEIEASAVSSQREEPLKKTEPSFSSPKMQPVSSSGDMEVIPMDNIRQKIMQHMISSRDTSVHVNALIEVDMTRIYNFIRDNKDDYQKREGVKLTYMPFISAAVVKALKEYPLVNATIDGTNIVKKKFINLGIAVAMEPNGLIVPNIKGAGERNLVGLAKAIADIANRARTKKLTPDDISNGTFSITNYGVFGTIFGTPIINQPEVAILGVGAVVKRPVVVEVEGMDTIAIKPIMSLTLAHDHRLVDGMLGGLFLKFVKESLEGFDSGNL